MERCPMFMDRVTQCHQGVSSSQFICRFSAIGTDTPAGYVMDMDTLTPRSTWRDESQKGSAFTLTQKIVCIDIEPFLASIDRPIDCKRQRHKNIASLL